MDWPTSICIIGSLASIAHMWANYTNFKKYRMDEVVKSLDQLEIDVAKLKEVK